MNITLCQRAILQEPSPFVAIGVCENESCPQEITPLFEVDDFQGKSGESIVLYPQGAIPARRVLLVGMGKREDLSLNGLRQAAARASREAHRLKLSEYSVSFPDVPDVPPDEKVQALVEGSELAVYRLLAYKSTHESDELHQVEKFTICEQHDIETAQTGITRGQAITSGVVLARNLANGPGNDITPARLGEVARGLETHQQLKVTVMSGEDIADFGGLVAVGKGSVNPPCFIVLEYGTAQPGTPTICLVGKGITFDTGGISIKPSQNMDDMKMDMGGAAAVLGTMRALGEMSLPLHVVGLVSAAENMPDANAYKPGDIIKTLSGKTVEVLNTDAEGRIVLADALFYAQRYQPDAIIDVATLTGAITIALGPHASGLMGNNQELQDRLLRAGEATHERVWQLPLWQEYKDMVKSSIADLQNIASTREAGSIVASAFLSAFVGEYAWAHLDIAGTAWADKPSQEYQTKGALGTGVRLLIQMLRDWKNL